MRTLCTLSLIAASLLAGAQEAKRVTLTTVAMPVARVVEEIARQTKEPLAVSASNRSAIVVMHVKDAPLEKVLAQLAAVTASVWRQSPNGVNTLSQDASVLRASERKELLARADELRKALEKLNPSAAASGAQVFPGAGGAGSRTVAQLASALDPMTLASIGPDARLVFSTHPTRMQLPLGPGAGPLLTKMIQEHNAQTSNANTEQDDQTKKLMEFVESMGFGTSTRPIEGNASKALLVATRMPFFDGLSLQLVLFDSRGNVIFRAAQQLMVTPMDFSAFMGGAPQEQPATPDKEIDLSDETKELRTYMGSFATGGLTGPPLSQALEDRLARPDLHDPLSYTESEAIIAIAKEKGLNLIGNLPDSLVSPLAMFMPGGKLMVNGYLRTMQSNRELQVQIKDGWLTVQPSKPAEAQTKRANRAALAKFIANVRSKSLPSLDDYASYALVAEPPMEAPAAMLPLLIFAPNSMSAGANGMLNWDVLRLYGSLGPAQRRNLEGGGQLDLRTLTPQQRTLVGKLLFGASARLTATDKGNEEGGFLEMVASIASVGGGKSFREEPTELMPNGVPPAGAVTMSVASDHFVMSANAQGKSERRMGAIGVEELALIRYIAEDPNMAAMAGMMPKLDRFRVGQRRTLTLRIHVNDGMMVRHVLNDDKLDANAAVVGLDGAPQSFRERLEKRIAALKKNPLPFGPGMMPGRNVPPQ